MDLYASSIKLINLHNHRAVANFYIFFTVLRKSSTWTCASVDDGKVGRVIQIEGRSDETRATSCRGAT